MGTIENIAILRMENSLGRYSLNSRNAAMIKTGFIHPIRNIDNFKENPKLSPQEPLPLNKALLIQSKGPRNSKDCEGKSVHHAIAWSRIPLTNRLQAKTDGVNQYSNPENLEVDFHEVMDL